MKNRVLLLLAVIVLLPFKLVADEGMWMPLLLKDQKYAQMRKMGLKLSAEEIYSINKACIKDAVIGLMGEGANLRSFGTASFISDSGLIITNYHVVMSYIERFSSEQNDFLKFGYWAKNRNEESLCRGLQMKQLIRMEDVTDRILEGTQGLTGPERSRKIDDNGKKIAQEATKGTRHQVRMQALFGNNQYIMNVYAVYRDIRMVAAPPFAIGKFGGNSDNYSWPRHTGDFAILRVYAGRDNQPASYSKENAPYNPLHHLKISTKGVKEGDFVMIAGFPGSTRQFVPSFALEKIIYNENLHKVEIRREKMKILNSAIERSPNLKYRYTNRLSSVGNSYLRWRGEIMGVSRMGLVEQKRLEESDFQRWAESDPNRNLKYGSILREMEELYKEVAVYNLADAYFNEAGINGSEIVPFIGKFEKLAAIYSRKSINDKEAQREAERLVGLTNQFFQNWDLEVDRQMFRNLLVKYFNNMPEKFKHADMFKYLSMFNGDAERLTREIFDSSMFTNRARLLSFLNDSQRDVQKYIKEDPLYKLSIAFYMVNVDRIMRQRSDLQSKLQELNSVYMKGLLEKSRSKALYPDANGSLRISYGVVKGARAQDGLCYEPFTTLDGAVDKFVNNPNDEEFYLPKKIRDLHQTKDYGNNVASDGRLYVNFLANLHTTSGNSGSPVLNSKGELVGVNFDRIWQGVASDYRYNNEISRSITVDIRYILFILEKYSPSGYVLNELKIK